MNFLQAIATGFKKYTTWRGRATRSEYWYWQLFIIIGYGICWFIDTHYLYSNDPEELDDYARGMGFCLVLMPSMAVQARRLHDIGWSGRWVIANIIAGGTFGLIMGFIKGKDEKNKYDDTPPAGIGLQILKGILIITFVVAPILMFLITLHDGIIRGSIKV